MRVLLALVALALLPALAAFFFIHDRPAGLQFTLVSYDDLPGWSGQSVTGAHAALVKSCEKIQTLPEGRRLPGAAVGGRYSDWRPACDALLATDASDLVAVVEEYFLPLSVSVSDNEVGTFTGYHEALLQGSFTPTERYNVPLYGRPPELVQVDLGLFRAHLAGERIAGTVKNGRLHPFPNRRSIMDGAIENKGLEVLWVDSAVDAYFLHVQGSGRVRLPDGRLIGIGYAAQNGHPNRLVGRELIERGAIPKSEISAQSIRAWFKENPEKTDGVLGTDPSFVFFRPLEENSGPFGSAAVSLTPGHSLAVDRRHLPLHAPLWLTTEYPDPASSGGNTLPLNRMVVAQDTGGAINGEIRGDVFWGFGDDAEEIAGRMISEGRYWLLLPRRLALEAAGEVG